MGAGRAYSQRSHLFGKPEHSLPGSAADQIEVRVQKRYDEEGKKMEAESVRRERSGVLRLGQIRGLVPFENRCGRNVQVKRSEPGQQGRHTSG